MKLIKLAIIMLLLCSKVCVCNINGKYIITNNEKITLPHISLLCIINNHITEKQMKSVFDSSTYQIIPCSYPLLLSNEKYQLFYNGLQSIDSLIEDKEPNYEQLKTYISIRYVDFKTSKELFIIEPKLIKKYIELVIKVFGWHAGMPDEFVKLYENVNE